MSVLYQVRLVHDIAKALAKDHSYSFIRGKLFANFLNCISNHIPCTYMWNGGGDALREKNTLKMRETA